MGTDTREMPVHVEQGPTTPSVRGGRDTAIDAAGCTHRGCHRDENQDRLYVGDAVFAVADGIGGRHGGGIAAELALEPMGALDRRSADAPDVSVALRDAVDEANARVRARRRTSPGLREMGTTLTAMVVDGADVHVAQVGDSRLYRLRGDVLEQLTTDHTLVQQLVAQGRLSPSGAQDHPHGNVITRAVGARPRVDVEMTVVDLAAGDTFLVCSDGLPGALTEDALTAALGSNAPVSEVADRLVDEAIRADVRDNVTALVVRPAPV